MSVQDVSSPTQKEGLLGNIKNVESQLDFDRTSTVITPSKTSSAVSSFPKKVSLISKQEHSPSNIFLAVRITLKAADFTKNFHAFLENYGKGNYTLKCGVTL